MFFEGLSSAGMFSTKLEASQAVAAHPYY